MADDNIPPNNEGDAKPWQPELSALKEQLTDSQTQYQSLKQQTEGLSESLTQSRQELIDLGQKVQLILKESAPPPDPPPPPPPPDPNPEPKKPITKKESTEAGKGDLPKTPPEPPTPPPAPEKQLHKRRSI